MLRRRRVVRLTSDSDRLKPLDIEIMKRLGTRVHVIPVIAKADTLTQNDLFTFKQRVSPFLPPSHLPQLSDTA